VKQSVTLATCPVCDSSDITNSMNVRDHMITQEIFTVQKCGTCDFYFTNPRPAEEIIGNYYKSEEYVSHSSSNKGIINKLYNIVRGITLKQKRAVLEQLTDGRSLLDIGCGTGHFLNECKTNGWSVLGLEPDADARSFTKEKFGIETLPVEELYEREKSSFDVITMWHVLEHVYHLKKDVRQISGLIKPGGFLIIAVPNRESWDARNYKELWAAYDVPRHLYHFSEKNVIELMKQFDLKHQKTLPMKFDSFYVSMLSEKYRKGSLFKAMVNGFRSNLKAKSGFGYSSQIYIFKK